MDADAENETKQDKIPSRRQVIIILDMAQLETVKTKKGDFELLNCDDHINIMRKHNKDPQKFRPDILHQELMAALDSPLNKAGLMKIYVHTEKNVLFEVHPQCRIPRTFKRFSGLMVQLLHKLKIRSSDGQTTLLKVIKNPLSKHLPAGIRCYGMSHTGTLFNSHQFVRTLPEDAPVAFVIGAFAVGVINAADHPYMTESVSISEYPLSGVVAMNRMIGALENHWGVL